MGAHESPGSCARAPQPALRPLELARLVWKVRNGVDQIHSMLAGYHSPQDAVAAVNVMAQEDCLDARGLVAGYHRSVAGHEDQLARQRTKHKAQSTAKKAAAARCTPSSEMWCFLGRGDDTVGAMGAEGSTPESEHSGSGLRYLSEVACRYRADEIWPEELPMIAAEALAAGLDTPALCELAGLSRNADAHDIRDAFEQALGECEIGLPDRSVARRHGLRRLAARFVDGEVPLTGLTAEDPWGAEAETAAEQAFVALIPPCTCCIEYTLGLDQQMWATELRNAALVLTSSPPVSPGC